MGRIPKIHRPAALLAWLLVLGGIVLTLLPYREYLVTRALFDDDQRQHLLPAYARQCPADFREGFLAGYASHYVPPAYGLLIRAGSRFVDPLVFCKALGMGLLVWTYLLGFALGWRLAGPWGGCITALLLMHCGEVESATFSGLFRSFGFPLALTFLYGLAARRPGITYGALIAQALIYPPVFLICWLAQALTLGFQFRSLWRGSRRCLLAFAAVSAVCATLLLAFERKPESWGKPFTRAEAGRMEEWQRKDGRLREFPWPSEGDQTLKFLQAGLNGNFWARAIVPEWAEAAGANAGLAVSLWIAVLGAALFLRPRPGWLLAFAAAAFAVYFASRHLAFRLGWPDRYLLYGLPLCMILLFPVAWRAAGERSPRWGRIWRGLALAAVAALALVTPLGAGGPQENLCDVRHMEPEWRAARALPSGCLFAGWPTDLDSLPLLSQKEPFINYEHAYPLYRGYYAAVRERILDSMRLTFATSPAAAAGIVRKYGLTHLLVERQTLTHEGPTPGIFAPYNDLAAALRRGSPPDRFVFNRAPPESIVHDSGRYFIVDLRRWMTLAGEDPAVPGEPLP